MILFIILNFLDCVTTFIGLKLGLIEGNAIIASLLSQNVYIGLTMKMLLAILIGILLKRFKPNLFKLLNIAFTVIVVWNVFWIVKSWL